jgi:hypothetical protein
MTQIAQPQVSTVSVARTHRTLMLGVLGALVVLTTTLILVIGNGGGGSGTSIPTSSPRSVGFEAGPAAGSPSAVSEAFGIERGGSGISLTTNVPAPPSVDEGPVAGTPSAVSAALQPAAVGGAASGVPAAASVSPTQPPQYIGHHAVAGELSATVQSQPTTSYERQTPGQRP